MNGDDLDSLVMRVRAGDDAAFTTLVEELHGDLCAFVSVRVPRLNLIEEVANDALATAFERLRDYRPGGNFRAWVKGIARNITLRHLRDARQSARAATTDVLETALTQAALMRMDESRDEANASRLTSLRQCLDRLPPTARELITWRYGEDLPLPQVAQRAGRTTAGVANLLLRLRSQLRACIERASP